jgi:hypothetical protein
MNFLERALYTASKGVPVIRLGPKSKAAVDSGWPELATTDFRTLQQWNLESSEANCAAVAQARLGGYWMFEVDSSEALDRLEKETGQTLPNTYRVRSRPGRGHYYWKQTAASIAMGNLSQTFVKNGDWSARVDGQYVVAAYSIHPHSQKEYTPLSDDPIIEAPDWLVAWCISQKISAPKIVEQPEVKRDAAGLVPHGSIHGYMLHEAGKLRAKGLGVEAIDVALMELVHKNCVPPIDDSLVHQMARSICNFPEGQSTDLILTQAPAVTTVLQPESVELPQFDDLIYPKFPSYVMEGTSLYNNFVKPVCDVNSRIPYFMWLPAMIILLNYIGPKIKIAAPVAPRPFRGSVYSIFIGKKGRSLKSSSVEDAFQYFEYIGIKQNAGRDMKNAEGRSVVWTAGSPEGLGIDMQKTNCKNAILYYDELQQLTAKAGIDCSAMTSALLLMYEAKNFANQTKKESYNIPADTYCTSLIACTTDKKFAELWSRLAGSDTGLDDRFFFILQPENLPEKRLQVHVNTMMGSIETKKRIDKALQQAVFDFEDTDRLKDFIQVGNRQVIRAEKWALALAVDLGLSVIDGECVERAIDIVKYEIAVKKFLQSYEATTREGQIQLEVRRTLEQRKGRMEKRELWRVVNYDRHGTSLWNQAWKGLLGAGIIREEGAGTKGSPLFVQLLQKRDIDEDE